MRPLAHLPMMLALALSGCAIQTSSVPVANDLRPPAVVREAAGVFDNGAQYDAAPAVLKREPAAGHPYDWLDRQHATFRWVDAPLLGPHVLFLEWRRGGADGAISRQRLWVFAQRDGVWSMDFFTLPDAGTPARPRLDDDFRALRPEQLVGYGSACTLPAEPAGAAVVFSIPAGCSIVSRSGRRMQLEATVRFEADRIRYREQGVLEGGAIAFLVPGQPGLDYEFVRVSR
jgi:hypothetical protein